MTVRIAMWSGPRNLSTAMMRSWENRPDTFVTDEPFYASFLSKTGIDHPMAQESIESQSSDPAEVARTISGSAPDGSAIWFQKHMTHHMVPEIGRTWFARHRHAFLIRDPLDAIASYRVQRDSVTMHDLGYDLQVELYDEVIQRTGETPPVVEVSELLHDPRSVLEELCNALRVPFLTSMLSWPAGRRASDGVWGAHWYRSVKNSTGFEARHRRTISLSASEQKLADECRVSYAYLWERRLKPSAPEFC